MDKTKAKEQEYRSMEEYKRKYFPESFRQNKIQDKDTKMLGIAMARESLSKFKQLIQKEKVCL
jgi:hypothetical protein